MECKKIRVFALLLAILVLQAYYLEASFFNSGDIVFSVNKTDYYFLTGENAIIPLEIKNSYGKDISGILTYSYTQEINQNGMKMSSSQTNSVSFNAKDGKSVQLLNFGTSKSPTTLNIDLKFTYSENTQRVVEINGIKIHFVEDESQKQNRQGEQSKISSASKEYSQKSPGQNEQNMFSQMQNQINQMINSNAKNSQSQRQALQNSQLNQDSAALKKQLENELEQQKEMKKEFEKQLAKNPDFQKEQQELLDKGYNLSSASFNPTSNNSGDFKLEYAGKNGKTASIQGHMENGKISYMSKDSPESREKLLQKLEQNKDFNSYRRKLQKQGYNRSGMQIVPGPNSTKIKVSYLNPENQTASISAEIVNGTVRNVKLENSKKSSKTKNILWFILLLACAVAGYIAYKRLMAKNKKPVQREVQAISPKKPFNYKVEALKLLKSAEKDFKNKRYKDAYGKAGQSLRLFISYQNRLKKEVTNDEIISYLEKKGKDCKKLKECFDLCSLVEFARYKPNKEDFYKIANYAKKTINKHK